MLLTLLRLVLGIGLSLFIAGSIVGKILKRDMVKRLRLLSLMQSLLREENLIIPILPKEVRNYLNF